MVTGKYKCPECPRVFKTDSGRDWHVAHRHEIKKALSAIREEYESKLSGLRDENGFYQRKAADFEVRSKQAMDLLILEKAVEANEHSSALESKAEARYTRDELRKASLLIAAQGRLIEEKLGIPFDKTLEGFGKVLYPDTAAATDASKKER